MTISVRGERYSVFKDGELIGMMFLEDDCLSIELDVPVSVDDFKDLLDVVKKIEKEMNL